MLHFVVAAGLAFWLLKEGTRQQAPTPDTVPEPEPEPEPEPSPTPPPTRDFTEVGEWSGEGSVGENVVWLYERYLIYDDGERVKNGSSYVVVGNANHTSFLRENSNRGTIDIPARLSGGSVEMKNVKVFESIEAAMEYLNREEEEPQPDDPQRQPEDDDSGSGGGSGLPAQPGFGFGNSYTPTFGGGV